MSGGHIEFRIVEQIGGFGGNSWPWRWRVECREPSRTARFLWWTWETEPRWLPLTEWRDLGTCKDIIANGGELTRVVPSTGGAGAQISKGSTDEE